MKNVVVKFIDTLFPYHCRGCGIVGKLLCDDCRKNIGRNVEKEFNLGLLDGLFVVGWREGVLKKLVEDYKFRSVRGASRVLAELLDETVPVFDETVPGFDEAMPGFDEAMPGLREVIVVPLPTILRHIRERGFDHTLRIAREFAKMRDLKLEQVLLRANKTVQVGSDEKKREEQANAAYRVDEGVFGAEKTYLLIDDVWTTGASMRAAAEALKKKGAKKIYGAVIESGR